MKTSSVAMITSAVLSLSSLSFAKESTSSTPHKISGNSLVMMSKIFGELEKAITDFPSSFKKEFTELKPILEKFNTKELSINLSQEELHKTQLLYGNFSRLKEELKEFKKIEATLENLQKKTEIPEWLKNHITSSLKTLAKCKTSWQNSEQYKEDYLNVKNTLSDLDNFTNSYCYIQQKLTNLNQTIEHMPLSSQTKKELFPLEMALKESLTVLQNNSGLSLSELRNYFKYPADALAAVSQKTEELNSSLGEHKERSRVSSEDANKSLLGFGGTLATSFAFAAGLLFFLRRRY